MNQQFEQAQQLGALWLEMMTKMMSVALTTDPKSAPTDAARHIRDASLGALGQQADKYMRSPQFLRQVKESLNAQITFRKQLNQMLTDAHHSVQGVAKQDVDALSLSMRQLERRVLDRIETLCDRLECLTERLDALKGSSGASDTGDNNGYGQAKRLDPLDVSASTEPGME
jgi:hypothetical protein